MTVYKVIVDNTVVEFLNLVQAESFASQHGSTVESEEREIFVDYAQLINDAIRKKQEIAPALLRELYAQNTLAGISTEESDALFDEYADIILRIREGAFPTALHRLQQKQPSGFVTQELLDKWIGIISSYL